MAVTLSILICTLPERKQMFDALIASLQAQCFTSDIEILFDDGLGSVGLKRNNLLHKAQGDYVVFIDDDDEVSIDYVNSILAATRTLPDCIGVSGIMTTDGKDPKQWYISKVYKRWYEHNGIYYRTPNHISPVKRSIAVKVGFRDMQHGEDADYSRRLLPFLKKEVIIPGNIYLYKFNNKK